MTLKPCAIAYINDAGECEQIDYLPSDLEGDPDSTPLVRQADAEAEIALLKRSIALLKAQHERANAEVFRLADRLSKYEHGSRMVLNSETNEETR